MKHFVQVSLVTMALLASVDSSAENRSADLFTLLDKADSICNNYSQGGVSGNVDIGGDVKLKLSGLLSRVIKPSTSAKAEFKTEFWAGLPQNELGEAVLGGQNCAVKLTTIGLSYLNRQEVLTNQPWRWASDASTVPKQIDWKDDAESYRGRLGQTFSLVCPRSGRLSLDVRGTDQYTIYSSICTAAYHASVIDAKNGGLVTIEIGGGRDSFIGSSRNGLKTESYKGYIDSHFYFVDP